MTTHTFQARMPQLVAAVTPMTTVPSIMGALLGEHHRAPWPIYGFIILIAVVGIVLLVLYGFKKYPFIIDDAGITVFKRRFAPEGIVSIRFSRTSLNIMTNTWRKRGSVTFEKVDLNAVTGALREFAKQFDIRLEIR